MDVSKLSNYLDPNYWTARRSSECEESQGDDAASESHPVAGDDPATVAISLGCVNSVPASGRWEDCLSFVQWRATKAAGSSVPTALTGNALRHAVTQCTNQTGQAATCAGKLYQCMRGPLWPSDNWACFAGRGGNACFSRCQ